MMLFWLVTFIDLSILEAFHNASPIIASLLSTASVIVMFCINSVDEAMF